MEKTVTIGNKEIRLNNNIGWTFEYRDQFGTDIIPTLLPMIAAVLDVLKGILEQVEEAEEVNVKDILKMLDGDTLIDALIHLGGIEFIDFVNVTWSMAKSADESIPEPRTWVKEFDTFALDEIAPVVFELIYTGVVSEKNVKRLKSKMRSLQPMKDPSN